MRNILLILATLPLLISSCTKVSYPVDDYIGAYSISGIATHHGIGKDHVSEEFGSLLITPAGKVSLNASLSLMSMHSSVQLQGSVVNGTLKFAKAEDLEKKFSVIVNDHNADVLKLTATLTIKDPHATTSSVTYELDAKRK